MRSVLLDAGALVAILNRNDRYHTELSSLLYAAWRTKVREVWSIDTDFTVYRLPDRSRFKVVPGR